MRLAWLPIILAFTCASHVRAASFDCAKAATPQERAVCADAELSRKDDELAASYRELLGQLSPNGAAEVRQDQRDWILWLQRVCPDNNQSEAITVCLKNKYFDHVATLKQGLLHVGGMTILPRVKVMTAPNKEKPIPGVVYPAVSQGYFAWPEIDRPTREQAAWNSAAHARVAARQQIEDAEVSVSWELKSANQELISLDLEDSRYDFGAAHPNESMQSFNWWIKLQRPTRAADVFRPGSGWEAALARFCYEELKSADRADDLFDDNTVRKAISLTVKNVQNWSLSSGGLIIEFGEYSVAPRVAGFLSTLIPWSRLKSYLAPGFDPAKLPPSVDKAPPQ